MPIKTWNILKEKTSIDEILIIPFYRITLLVYCDEQSSCTIFRLSSNQLEDLHGNPIHTGIGAIKIMKNFNGNPIHRSNSRRTQYCWKLCLSKNTISRCRASNG